jgi:hypothetical protein
MNRKNETHWRNPSERSASLSCPFTVLFSRHEACFLVFFLYIGFFRVFVTEITWCCSSCHAISGKSSRT